MKKQLNFLKKLIPAETSKRIAGGVLFFCGGAAIAVIVGWFKGLPDVPVILGIFATPVATALSWYFSKAKAENKLKIKYGRNDEKG